MTVDSAIAPMMLDGPMDAEVFEAYLDGILFPALPANAIVVMDNLAAHKTAAVRERFAKAGVELRYLPPYSPDFNPIELMWSKVKTALRAAKARSHEDLQEAIAAALSTITLDDTAGFFRHCFVGVIY